MSHSFRFLSEASSQKRFYETLYQDYIKLMYATAKRFCSESIDLQDVVQDAFLNLLNHYDTLKSLNESALASYIYFTVKNVSINHRRKESSIKNHETALYDIPAQSIKELSDIAEAFLQIESHNELESVLDMLPETDNLLLTCKYFLNYSNEEIAAQLSCNPSSIRMMLTRARRKALILIKKRGLFDNE